MIKRCIVLLLTVCMYVSTFAYMLGNNVDVDAAKSLPLISGSFIQGWLCRDWSQTRWNEELSAMKELGMETLIIQSSYDWATTAANSSIYGQDWSKYTTTSRYSLYPTNIAELAGAYNSSDQLEKALVAAKEYDMTIFIGLISDDRWWRFGWGIPTAANAGVDLITDSYFARWCDYNGELSAQMIEEIWERYADKYADQIGGWYYHNEIWNFDSACAGTDNGVYAKILADNFNTYIKAIEENCPDKPIMISPYFNRTLSTGMQYSNFWKDIFEKADFRAGDIFAPQDCIGEHQDKINTAGEWIGGLADATATEKGLRFWVNNETFTPAYTSAPVDRLISQIEATRQYAETHILFSWNHYYNPIYNSSYQKYNDELADYIEISKPVNNQIEGGIEINGYQISTITEGARTIYSVERSINNKDVVECGLVYAMADYVDDKEIVVGSASDYVKSFPATDENGKCAYNFSDSDTATSYVMTMRFATKSALEFETKYTIKAYALLSDGTYVYTNSTSYTVYNTASYLYDRVMMKNLEAHKYLYNNILSIVNTDYKEVDYYWGDKVIEIN